MFSKLSLLFELEHSLIYLQYLWLVQVARQQKYSFVVRFIFILWLIIFIIFSLYRVYFFQKCSFPSWRRARWRKRANIDWNMRVWKCEKLIFTYYFCRCPVVKKTENLTQSCFLNTSFFLFLLSGTCWDHWHRTVDSWGPRDSRERGEVSSLKLTQRFVKSNPDSWIK